MFLPTTKYTNVFSWAWPTLLSSICCRSSIRNWCLVILKSTRTWINLCIRSVNCQTSRNGSKNGRERISERTFEVDAYSICINICYEIMACYLLDLFANFRDIYSRRCGIAHLFASHSYGLIHISDSLRMKSSLRILYIQKFIQCCKKNK